MRLILIFLVVALFALPTKAARVLDKNLGWPGTTLAGHNCAGKPQGFGPFDYNDKRSSTPGGFRSITGSNTSSPLRMVEVAHFKDYVERLIRGKTAKDPIGDIDYTLRAFPNHPRALWAVSRYFLRLDKNDPDTTIALQRGIRGTPPPECFFQRAKLFAPEDATVSMVFGIYLHKRGKYEDAIKEYSRALEGMPNNAELAYNTGLTYYELGDFVNAQQYADRAYSLGYPLQGLKRKLEKAQHMTIGDEASQ